MSAIERLIELDRTAPKRILVVGDTLFDEWIYGLATDSQDGCRKITYAPHGDHPLTTPGGAAGAARQLSDWNAKVFLGSILDPASVPVYVLGCLQRVHIREYSSPGRGLPVKRRYLDGDKCVFRADCEDTEQHYGLTRSELIGAREKVVQAVRHCGFQGVLISDYDKGFLDAETIQQIVRECKRQEIPCVADAKRGPETYKGQNVVLKVNQDWALHRAYEKILSTCWFAAVVVTRGSHSPHIFTPDAWREYVVTGDSEPCMNHVGAGDCFSSHLILALAHGLLLEEAAAIAHSAGRVYVQKRHGEPPTPQEIATDLRCEARAPQTSSGD